jgi:hypothetical protein
MHWQTVVNCVFYLSCNGLLLQVEQDRTSSNWGFTILDTDGSIVRTARPDKPAGTYLIASYPSWWNLGPDSWQEPSFNGRFSPPS